MACALVADNTPYTALKKVSPVDLSLLAFTLSMPPMRLKPGDEETGLAEPPRDWLESQRKDVEVLPKKLLCAPKKAPKDLAKGIAKVKETMRKLGLGLGCKPSKPVMLCSAHQGLNPVLIHQLFVHISREVTHADRLWQHEHLLTSELRSWAMRMMGVCALWSHNKVFHLVARSNFPRYHDELKLPHLVYPCEACVLSVIGAREQILCDLRASLLSRMYAEERRAMAKERSAWVREGKRPEDWNPTPDRVYGYGHPVAWKFVEAWIKHLRPSDEEYMASINTQTENLGWAILTLREFEDECYFQAKTERYENGLSPQNRKPYKLTKHGHQMPREGVGLRVPPPSPPRPSPVPDRAHMDSSPDLADRHSETEPPSHQTMRHDATDHNNGAEDAQNRYEFQNDGHYDGYGRSINMPTPEAEDSCESDPDDDEYDAWDQGPSPGATRSVVLVAPIPQEPEPTDTHDDSRSDSFVSATVYTYVTPSPEDGRAAPSLVPRLPERFRSNSIMHPLPSFYQGSSVYSNDEPAVPHPPVTPPPFIPETPPPAPHKNTRHQSYCETATLDPDSGTYIPVRKAWNKPASPMTPTPAPRRPAPGPVPAPTVSPPDFDESFDDDDEDDIMPDDSISCVAERSAAAELRRIPVTVRPIPKQNQNERGGEKNPSRNRDNYRESTHWGDLF